MQTCNCIKCEIVINISPAALFKHPQLFYLIIDCTCYLYGFIKDGMNT